MYGGAKLLLVTALPLFAVSPAIAQPGAPVPHYAALDINNVFNFYCNNGGGSYNPYSTSNEGFEFLKGTGKTLMYQDGIVWGGFQQGRSTPSVGGSATGHGLLPGPILTLGSPGIAPVAGDPSNQAYRIYRVRPDVGPRSDSAAAIARIAADDAAFLSRYQSATPVSICQSYIKDWMEWPADLGAPYTDVNGDGKYDPLVDVPGQPGADQTLWYVANDVDAATTAAFTGSAPLGLEMQRTIWGYKRTMGALTTTIFHRTRLINKSGLRVDSMFIGQWSDPDIGDAGDDAVGYDMRRGLAYAYNAKSNDAMYENTAPACGFLVLEGPVVPSTPADSAFRDGRWIAGARNLNASTFIPFLSTIFAYSAPIVGTGGDVQWYRALNGFSPRNGMPFIDPTTNTPIRFLFTGDPVADTGSIQHYGIITPVDDQMFESFGPFTLEAGGTQEIVVAQVGAVGSDRLSSITALRSAVDKLREGYIDIINSTTRPEVSPPPAVPRAFALYQNYPNPFNPETSIRYDIPVRSRVTLEIYSVLGQRVAALVNDTEEAGTHEVRFNAAGLASGVYFYRLQAGAYVRAKKLTVVR